MAQRIERIDLNSPPAAAKDTLDKIKAKYGKVPNIFATIANSPASLKAIMGMFGALAEGELNGVPHEAIALRVGEIHGCKYCTAAHTAKAKMAGASADDAIAFRKGEAGDTKVQALIKLSETMVEKRGQLTDADLQAAKGAGVTEGEMIETVAIVALNTFTNYINALVQTEVDFPAAPEL